MARFAATVAETVAAKSHRVFSTYSCADISRSRVTTAWILNISIAVCLSHSLPIYLSVYVCLQIFAAAKFKSSKIWTHVRFQVQIRTGVTRLTEVYSRKCCSWTLK